MSIERKLSNNFNWKWVKSLTAFPSKKRANPEKESKKPRHRSPLHLISNSQFGNPHRLLVLTRNTHTDTETHMSVHSSMLCSHSQSSKTLSNFRSLWGQQEARIRRRLSPSKGLGCQGNRGWLQTAHTQERGWAPGISPSSAAPVN